MSVLVEASRDGASPADGLPDVTTVSVVICSNRPSGLAAAVESVLANQSPPFELVVVAQGPDAAWAALALSGLSQTSRHDPRLRIVHDPGRGLSHARNVGVRETTGDLILFTDDDCVVASDWVASHVACYRERADVMLVYGKVVPPTWYTGAEGFVPTFEPSAHGDPFRQRGGLVLGIGANMSLRRTLLDRIGPFDEMLGAGGPLVSAEDMDLAMRAFTAKQVSMADSRPLVTHEGGLRPRGRESRLLWQRDGIGLGAVLAKALRSGHWRAAAGPLDILVGMWRNTVVKVVNGRRPFGLAMVGVLTLSSLDGFLRGLRQPLMRTPTVHVYVGRD
jgi:GT2 family glycosyltransferase